MTLQYFTMQIISTLIELRSFIAKAKENHQTIGFVPTMGALHEGHLSLIKQAIRSNQVTVVSIFVNPSQFNDPSDFEHYPRTLDRDIRILEPCGIDVLFAPSAGEMYPEPDQTIFDLGQLDTMMEGKHRKGHFNGVAQIVYKLFTAVMPDKAYFGEKDFQQVAIIKQLVKNKHLDVEIVTCPIVREPDGLAMSSRNVLLSPEQRKSSVSISKTLFESSTRRSEKSPNQLKNWVIDTINQVPDLDVAYFEIVNSSTLLPVESWSDSHEITGCIAVRIGAVRLIDNIRYNS